MPRLTQVHERAGLRHSTKLALGATVLAAQNHFTFADTTAKTMFALPAGARIINIVVDVETAFNSSGTDLLDLGKTGTDNHYINDLDIAAVGRKAPTLTNLGVSTTPITVIATFVQSVADATTGSATVTVTYTAS